MTQWRTTLVGAGLAGIQAVAAIVDWDQLSVKQLSLRFGMAAAAFLFGLWAHDPQPADHAKPN